VTADRRSRRAVVLLAGMAYLVIGIVFAGLAARATSEQWSALWRLLAWAVSLVVFAAHIGHEHFRFGHRPRTTAWRVAVAVGLGAFGLAVAAGVHAVWRLPRTAHLVNYGFAMVVWPLVTAVPAFVVALLAALGLQRLRRSP
jgi:hypothetical protein